MKDSKRAERDAFIARKRAEWARQDRAQIAAKRPAFALVTQEVLFGQLEIGA